MKDIQLFNELIKLAVDQNLKCAIVNTNCDPIYFDNKIEEKCFVGVNENFPMGIIDQLGVNNSCKLKIENDLLISDYSSSFCGATILYENYCAAIIGHSDYYESLGIDLAPLSTKLASVWRLFSSTTEIRQAEKFRIPRAIFEKITFSAKDAARQCLSSRCQTYSPDLSSYQLEIIETSSEHRIIFSIPKLGLKGSTIIFQGFILSFVYLPTHSRQK